MCLIAVGLKSEILDLPLSEIWDSNPHGAGIGYTCSKTGHGRIVKGLMSLTSVKRALHKLPERGTIAVHWRFATHGARSQENTHPHPMGKNRYLMHNGVLNHFGASGDKGESDSADLARSLAPLSTVAIIKILASLPGRYAIIGSFGVLPITPERSFETHKGCLVSNSHFVPVQYDILTPRRALRGFAWSDD
jgi:hypothetical protein